MELSLRRRDRWSLRLGLWRAERAGRNDRRVVLLDAARAAAQGAPVADIVSDTSILAHTELRLIGGATLQLGRCHRPAVARLVEAIDAGGAWVERIADHGHCFGVYLRTGADERLALLTSAVRVADAGGGSLVDLRPLALI